MDTKPRLTIQEATEQLLSVLLSDLDHVGLPDLERQLRYSIVSAVIRRHRGNLCQAARVLKIHRNTVNREVSRMRELHLPDPVKLAHLERKAVQSQKQLNFQRMVS